ncbi:hypothetical protein AB1Y20_012363 [Prymnesium parvum]|uniref:Uncharacterized protein n=1 Tax=Prymnesium parvum TaxID=97485 RepID=A0AB34INB0_PRYPA
MGPVMNFSGAFGSSLHDHPAKRAALDEARRKARLERRNNNPGPGAYDVKRPLSSTGDLAGSTAFKSKSARSPMDDALREAGDPGLYTPSVGSFGKSAMSSFNKTVQSGSGNFGSRTKRAELVVPNDAPGPGSYDAKEPARPEAKEGSAFASRAKRGTYVGKTITPGAGEYEPRPTSAKIPGGESAFRNRDDRFHRSIEQELLAHVGPGSYGQGHNTIKSKAGKTPSARKAPFSTTASLKRGEQAAVKADSAPGPGAYNAQERMKDMVALAGSTAFKSKSERGTDNILKESGDPGLYHPNVGSFSHSAKSSFNKADLSGSGHFGSRTKRAELNAPGDGPGPGTYDAKEPARPEAKQGSAFASRAKRGTYVRKDTTPGAGEYEPRPTSAKIPGGESIFRSREERFKITAEDDEIAQVGPGSYGQEQHTIKQRNSKGADRVSSAFASTSIRQTFPMV